MTLKIEIQIKRANLTSRMHSKLMKIINRRAMERQWAERVPKHFEEGHEADYEIRNRSVNYVKTKRKLKRHNKPNVFTGDLKRSLRHKITATQYGARLSMRATIGKKIDPQIWATMTKAQKTAIAKKQPRLAGWQKREIAIMSRAEIKEERKKQASEYRSRALSPEFARKRTRRIK